MRRKARRNLHKGALSRRGGIASARGEGQGRYLAQAVQDENFLEVLDKYDIQVKKSTWCYIRFEDKSKNWIPEKDAIRIKSELEKNENIFSIYLDYRY